MDYKDENQTYVNVRVSKEMKKLSDTLSMLNYFVWTSDIAYLYSLDKIENEFKESLHQQAYEKLKQYPSVAWERTKEEIIKYRRDIHELLADINNNRVNVYKSALIFFYTAFEEYIKSKTNYIKDSFIKYFYQEHYINVEYCLEEKAIYLADASKEVRNYIVHNTNVELPITNNDISKILQQYFKKINGGFNKRSVEDCLNNEKEIFKIVSKYYNNKIVQISREEFENKALCFYNNRYVNICSEDKKPLRLNIEECWKYFFITAERKVVMKYETTGIKLDHFFFYMLFSFTNLFGLAFQLEELLFDPIKCTEKIERKFKDVRRRAEMIIK